MAEIWDFISDKLGLKAQDERDCVKNILVNTIMLNETQDSELNDEKVDALVVLMRVYIGEVLKVMNDPEAYKRTLDKFKVQLENVNVGAK